MIEGLSQLLWAARDLEVLPLRWRAFAWVHDWRLLRKRTASGEPTDEKRRVAIDKALQQFGEQFRKKSAVQGYDKRGPVPSDPYHTSWRTGRSMKDICEAVSGGVLYDGLYAPFSDWHHWGAGGLGQALRRKDNHVIYSSLSESEASAALAVAFQCLLQTAEVVEWRLQIGIGPQLSELNRSSCLRRREVVCFVWERRCNAPFM